MRYPDWFKRWLSSDCDERRRRRQSAGCFQERLHRRLVANPAEGFGGDSLILRIVLFEQFEELRNGRGIAEQADTMGRDLANRFIRIGKPGTNRGAGSALRSPHPCPKCIGA